MLQINDSMIVNLAAASQFCVELEPGEESICVVFRDSASRIDACPCYPGIFIDFEYYAQDDWYICISPESPKFSAVLEWVTKQML